jgi:uncharacterized protein (TIGR01777 family)
MKVLIVGGSGFIGSHLCKFLAQKSDYSVTIFTRNIAKYNHIANELVINQLDINVTYDVIINLAGEKIDKQRWTDKFKKELYVSRINATEMIIEYIRFTAIKPRLLISGSAIGYYGGKFSHQLCSAWEKCASQAKRYGVIVAILRTGVVLSGDGGALKKLLWPFRLGLGVVLGQGSQFMSWIHIKDYIQIVEFIINKDLDGEFNMVSEHPVTNKHFSVLLAKALHRPLLFRMPSQLVIWIFGQMGQELLLDSIKVFPEQILAAGYSFQFSELDQVFKDILDK